VFRVGVSFEDGEELVAPALTVQTNGDSGSQCAVTVPGSGQAGA